MKKIILLLFSAFPLGIVSQQFSVDLYFEDAAGNKDTITVGYDPAATDTINAALGEMNIIQTPLNPNLDVRISNEIKNRSISLQTPGAWASKKKFVDYNCPTFDYSQIFEINIFSTNWPVSVSWNHTLFSDSCHNGSVITSSNPGGWWDVSNPAEFYSFLYDSTQPKIINEYKYDGIILNYYAFINGNDTVYGYWLAIGSFKIHSTSIEEPASKEVFSVFPNPVLDELHISSSYQEATRMDVYSLLGQKLSSTVFTGNGQINMNSLPAGIYFYEIQNAGGNIQSGKIIKQ